MKRAKKSGVIAVPSHCGELEGSIGYALRRAHVTSYQLFAKHFQQMDVRPAQFALLALIEQHREISQSVAGEALGIEKGNLTGLLLELTERGLVRRVNSAADRRAYTLQLTAKGMTYTRRAVQRHREYENVLTANLSAADQRRLHSLLKKLVNAGAQ